MERLFSIRHTQAVVHHQRVAQRQTADVNSVRTTLPVRKKLSLNLVVVQK
jgi:hypothetical protein